ncbi:MAG: hypothetical protein ABI068_11820 [Ktedonobacterales bacterium]
MREDMVTPTTARRLAQEGVRWEPQIGDWCSVLGAAHIGEGQAGLWLVAGILPYPDGLTQLLLVDAAGQWPQGRVALRDCLWLPTAGKLKTWLRSRGYRVATSESAAALLGGSGLLSTHVCRLTRTGDSLPVDGEGMNEAEAVAVALLHTLGAQTADSSRLAW